MRSHLSFSLKTADLNVIYLPSFSDTLCLYGVEYLSIGRSVRDKLTEKPDYEEHFQSQPFYARS